MKKIKVLSNLPYSKKLSEDKKIVQNVCEPYDPMQPGMSNSNTIYVRKKRTFPLLACIDGNDWPQETDECCRLCTEPFEGVPFGIPVRFDDKHNIYSCWGLFCSVHCALRYNKSFNRGGKTSLTDVWIRQLAIEEFKVPKNVIRAAPPVEMLKKFGGSLTIDEFRKHAADPNSYTVEIPHAFERVTLFAETSEMQRVEQNKQHERLEQSKQQPNPLEIVSYNNQSHKPRRLTRSKPLKQLKGIRDLL
jgi:hypothetical protein